MLNTTPTDNPQTALVTGGAIRLGKAISLFLAQQGYNIALHYNSSATEAKKTASEIEKLGVQCLLFQQDLSQVNQLATLVENVQANCPTLSVLVNNASVYTQSLILNTSPEVFNAQIDVNLRAPFFLTQAFAKVCQQGNIINIIDNKIAFNQNHYAAYLLSKKSLTAFTKMAALELAPLIRVNGIAPGVVLPAQSRTPEYIEWRKQGIPLKRKGDTTHITETVKYVLANEFVTGQIFVVDGGESITNMGLNAGYYKELKA